MVPPTAFGLEIQKGVIGDGTDGDADVRQVWRAR